MKKKTLTKSNNRQIVNILGSICVTHPENGEENSRKSA